MDKQVMDIKNIFVKDIHRSINGVVKAEQLDDAIIWQELNEYVITKELDTHFRYFFSAYLKVLDNPNDAAIRDKMGVWISGFFGSGKSHFLKVLSYLLENRKITNPESGETKTALDFFSEKISDEMFFADIKRVTTVGTTDVILFNIDSKADHQESKDVMLRVFMRVFNEKLGYCADNPHIANMERYLEKEGKLQAFHDEFLKQNGAAWHEDRDSIDFKKDEIVTSLATVLKMSQESADDWFEKAEERYSLNIENFAKLIAKYIEDKGSNHRVLFLVDEIGQFIGRQDSQLMLNLQTISENLGTYCKGKSWLVVTSQEDIDTILGEYREDRANDFSKIQGRFNTRLSLSSSNSDEVIQGRLLEKTEDAQKALEKIFEEKGDILRNQLNLVRTKTTMKNFVDKEDFAKNYPFAPFHFQLIQKIFEIIPKMGATGAHLSRGERSMIEAFQISAKEILKTSGNNTDISPLERMVPMHLFYAAIEGFLDTNVKRTVTQAETNTGLKPYDLKILKTLFLIRYIDLVPPNIDNLVSLSIEHIDQDKVILKKELEETLHRLESETLINRNGDLYYFLTDEERDVSSEIKNERLEPVEEINKMNDLFGGEILKNETKFKYSENKNNYPFSKIIDGLLCGSNRQEELILDLVTPLNSNYFDEKSRSHIRSQEGGGRIIIQFQDDSALWHELRIWMQTEKYIHRKTASVNTRSLKRILEERADENRERWDRMIQLLEEACLKADWFIMGQQREMSGKSAYTMVQDALTYLIKNVFNKLTYLLGFHKDPQNQIRETLVQTDIQSDFSLDIDKNLALKEVKNRIELMDQQKQKIVLSQLTETFEKKPYGWPLFETVILVTVLLKKNLITLQKSNIDLPLEEAAEPLCKQALWKQITILKRLVPDIEVLNKSRDLSKTLFKQMGPNEETALFGYIVDEVTKLELLLKRYKYSAEGLNFPGKKEIDSGLKLCEALLIQKDRFYFFKYYLEQKEEWLELSEDLEDIKEFFDTQKPIWSAAIEAKEALERNKHYLNKDADTKKLHDRLLEILSFSEPYEFIHELPKLQEKLDKKNDELILKARTTTEEAVELKLQQFKKELEKIEQRGDEKYEILETFRKLKKRASSEYCIADLSLIAGEDLIEAENEMVFELNEIYKKITEEQKEKDEIEAKKQAGTQAKTGETPTQKTTQKKAPVLKPIETIYPAKLNTKIYLATVSEVEEYIDTLKAKLLSAIDNGKRVKIN
jgi:hypothetical protein